MNQPGGTMPTTAAASPREVAFADGARWPALGLGTWRYGESRGTHDAEVAAVRRAFEIGYRVIDTAEMYAEGGAERVVGEALLGAMREGSLRRDEVRIVTKVYPHNASRAAMRRSCAASLRRLGIERIDLYLLHWRGGVPLAETVAAFEDLKTRGWIARWGVSNFDVDDLEDLFAVDGGAACAANQIYHALSERGPEFALLPWQRRHAMPSMAYSPLGQGVLARHAELARIAARREATPAQVALAALLAQPGVMPIPKTSDERRLRENVAALRLPLDAEDLAAIDRAFPPPRRKQPLATT